MKRSILVNEFKNKYVLEIGPFLNPLNCDSIKADIYSSDDIYKIANTNNYSYEYIPKIDIVIKPRDYSNIKDTYDIVFSSHVIEHTPDLIYHLDYIFSITNLYYLYIPDKRYSMDYYRKLTETEYIINCYQNKRTKPTIESYLDFCLNKTHDDAIRHWNNDHGLKKKEKISYYLQNYYRNKIINIHNYVFTADSFYYQISQIGKKKQFKIKEFEKTKNFENEFFCILEKYE